MTRWTRLMILSAVTLGLTACGGAKLGGGKEGAAQAAFQASQPAKRGNKTGQSLLDKALASGAATVSIAANCAHGGSASLVLDVSNTPTDGSLRYAITYDACNEDGQNEYNGTMATTMRIAIDPSYSSGAFIISMKGKLEIDGEISDAIDADVSMRMDFAATSTSSSVKLVLNGTIATESGNYSYANETISITAGELPQG